MMAKRAKNWRPDVYDLAARRPEPEAPSGVYDLAAATAAPQDQTTVAEVEIAAPPDEDYDDELLPEPTPVAPLTPTAKGKPDYRVSVKPAPQSDGDLMGLGGMIGGAIVGALFGLLLAPKRGEQTRRELVASARHHLDSTLGRASGSDEQA